MDQILIIGAGNIAKEYLKITIELGYQPIVVGRSREKVDAIKEEYEAIEAYSGGLHQWLSKHQPTNHSIIATSVEYLADATKLLIEHGSKQLLVEKPLTFYLDEAKNLKELAASYNAEVFIAFNRRNYQSVTNAKEMIHEDGGVSSFHFDFTEAIFKMNPNHFTDTDKYYWGIANSSHVIDTAFYLGGCPKEMESKQYGNAIEWHPAGSIFTGIGETYDKVPFSYHANWGCPGKWNIEVMTPKRKMLFSPMEKLHQQPYGSFKVEMVDIDYSLDEHYKPGFFTQVQQFLAKDKKYVTMPQIPELEKLLHNSNRIFNYN